MKVLSCFLLLQLFSCNLFAQRRENFLKVISSVELPVGFFQNGYKTGWGIYATDYLGIADKTAIALSSGIASWNAKNASIKAGMSISKLGIRQFISSGFYLQTDAGIAVGIKDWTGSSKFTFDGIAGYLVRTKGGGGVDFSAKVNRAFARTWVGLGVGYEFKL